MSFLEDKVGNQIVEAWGDTHRFGRAVKKVRSDCGNVIFEKPRPVHIEFLLLDDRSPVAPILDRIFPDRPTFRVDVKSTWLGEAEGQPLINPGQREVDGRSFAYWCFLAIGLGLTDLHSDNFGLVERANRRLLSVFDLEIAFERVNTLTQTHLIPLYRNTFRPFSAELVLTETEFCSAIDGLMDFFAINAGDYEKLVNESWISLSGTPIRVIVRDTRFYRKLILEQTNETISDSERQQVSFGDIPYFFRYLGKPDIYFFSSPNRIQKDCALSSIEPLFPNFFTTTRLTKVLPNILAQVVDRFYPKDRPIVRGKHFVAGKTKDSIWIKALNLSLEVRQR